MFGKKVVEAVFVPQSNDYGFFDGVLSIAENCGLRNVKAVHNKPKSIVVVGNDVYVCQTVKFSSMPVETEAIIQFNAMNGEFRLAKSVPDTTRYQVATEYLWIFLSAKLNFIPLNHMSALRIYFSQRTDTPLHYNDYEHDLYREDGTLASMVESVLALSFKYQR